MNRIICIIYIHEDDSFLCNQLIFPQLIIICPYSMHRSVTQMDLKSHMPFTVAKINRIVLCCRTRIVPVRQHL